MQHNSFTQVTRTGREGAEARTTGTGTGTHVVTRIHTQAPTHANGNGEQGLL